MTLMRLLVPLACCLLVLVPDRPVPGAALQKWALIIGISGYPHFDDRLRYSGDDAQAFYDFIQTPAGGAFRQDHVKLLLNRRATRKEIFAAMNWLHDVGSDDLLYVFFSGHGALDAQERAYLMPYDGEQARPEVQGFPVDQFLKMLKDNADPKQMVLFIDACHAAAVLMENGVQKGGSESVTGSFEKLWQQAFDQQQRVRMGFFAATSQQRSWEDDKLKHGLFTYYLIEALRKAAQAGQDGVVRAGEVRRYVEDQVETRARARFRNRQTPIVSPNFDPEFPLALRAGVQPPTDICPRGMHVAGQSCVADVIAECPPGLAFQPERGCVTITQPPTQPLPTARPPSLPATRQRPQMVGIPDGEFWMGSPETEPGRDKNEVRHRVKISRGFWMSATEVTQGEYQEVMGKNPSERKDSPELPVENVSWFDAVQYCNRLSEKERLSSCYRIGGREVTWPQGLACAGYRLPTEAEWEYAARSGGEGEYGTYEGVKGLDDIAWYSNGLDLDVHPVGQKKANAWGLHDMLGNVWEWVWDWYYDEYYKFGPRQDPIGPRSGSFRMYRGGSWVFVPVALRVAARDWSSPGRALARLGFRLSRSAP